MILQILNTVVGIVKILGGGLCFKSLSLLFIHGMYPQELTVLYLEMVCAAAGFIGALIGNEYICFRSKEQRGIRNALIFDIIISMVLAILIFSATIRFHHTYLEDTIMGAGPELWDHDTREGYKSAYQMAHAAGIVVILGLLFSLPLVYFNETE